MSDEIKQPGDANAGTEVTLSPKLQALVNALTDAWNTHLVDDPNEAFGALNGLIGAVCVQIKPAIVAGQEILVARDLIQRFAIMIAEVLTGHAAMATVVPHFMTTERGS